MRATAMFCYQAKQARRGQGILRATASKISVTVIIFENPQNITENAKKSILYFYLGKSIAW